MNNIHLDFQQARQKHIAFKTNLRTILYGGVTDTKTVLSQYECSVGKWIYEHALRQFGYIPEIVALERAHADIHTCARKLVGLYNEGKVEEARQGLTEMEAIADVLIRLLGDAEMRMKTAAGLPEEHDNNGNGPYASGNQTTRHLYNAIQDLDQKIKEHTAIAAAAREQNARNEHKFRDTVMQAPVGITILKGPGLIVEMANETYLNIIDKTSEDVTGKSLFASLPEIQAVVEPLMLRVLETGEPFYGNEFEVFLNRFGKKERSFFNFVYHPLREEDGTVSGIIVVATDVTGQVRSRHSLETREQQFRYLVMRSPIAMTIFRGPDHIIELANNTLLKNIWRKTLPEVEGKKLLDVFPELNQQQFPMLLKKVLETGVTYRDSEAEAIVSSSDGFRKFYLDFEYAPLEEPDGTISGVMVTVNDTTEKVESRIKIEMARKRYSVLIETLPVALFTIDTEGYLDLYNQAAVTLWGREPDRGKDKWCGSHGLFTLDGVCVPHEHCPMATALKENRSIHTEAYVQRPDGTMRHVIAHPQPLHDIEGNVTGAMNVLIDITERKEIESALRSSEEKFRLLANSMPQFIWTSDPEGNLNYFSQSVFDYSGLSEQQVMSEGWLQIVHPDDRQENIDLWVRSISSGEDFHYEHRFRRSDGVYRWQLSRAVPQRDAQGNIKMWVGTSTDINERRIFADELKVKVEERTRELKILNDNLIRSNNELVQFAYVASHDLQEPLRKIQTFISRIIEMDHANLSEKGKDFFARIQKSSSRTQRLIQDLLAYSRANTTEKLFEPTDLNMIIQKVEDDLSVLISQKQAVIECDPLPTISAISFQMEQLFTNLINNAIKFAKEDRHPQIRISAVLMEGKDIDDPAADTSKKYYRIAVSDNGIGFEPEFRERIFMVFQRLHTQVYEGTGIGLAICKRIAENHDGIIAAASVPGKGATFYIYFPV